MNPQILYIWFFFLNFFFKSFFFVYFFMTKKHVKCKSPSLRTKHVKKRRLLPFYMVCINDITHTRRDLRKFLHSPSHVVSSQIHVCPPIKSHPIHSPLFFLRRRGYSRAEPPPEPAPLRVSTRKGLHLSNKKMYADKQPPASRRTAPYGRKAQPFLSCG